MLFTFIMISALVIYFLSMFTGGKSWREVRELFYGNYYAEDAVINETDKPNSPRAVQNCIDNGIGIKTEVMLTGDKRVVVSAYDDLSKEYGVDKKISSCTLEEVESLGVMTLTQFINQVGAKVPVILELKVSGDNETLCRGTADAITASELKNIAVCSFHAGMVTWFRDHKKDIFRGHDRSFVISKIVSGEIKLNIHEVFYQMSPAERMYILREVKDGNIAVDREELYAKLTPSEQRFLGGKLYEIR